MKTQKIILQVLAVLFIFGGVVRLLVNQDTFEIFGMGNLWSGHPYFIYIYRVLGAFVMLTGLVLFSLSRNIQRHLEVLQMMLWGFLLVGIVMALAGYFSGIHPFFYIPDFVFCFFLAGLMYWVCQCSKETGS